MRAPQSISRRTLLKLSLSAATTATLAKRSTRAHANTSKPNILLLMADQHRPDCLGADGNPLAHTPNLDRLAAEGAYFKHAYSTTPTCTPARACLLTGMNPWNNGMLGYTKVPEKYPVEMPRLLADAGYYTLGIGKMHWTPQRNLHGFHNTLLDESGRAETPEFRSDYRAWFYNMAPTLNPDETGLDWNDYRARPYALPERLHPSVWTASTAVNFLNNHDGAKPFFLKVSFARPHSPYDPPQRVFDRFKDAAFPKAPVGDWAARYAPRSDDSNQIWHGDMGEDIVRNSRRGYYASVTFVDEQIGRILDTLDARNMLEDTLIIYISDHGDMTGDHHLWRKSYAYEASARIPYIVRWPKGMLSAKRGITIDAPVEIRDVLPTFADAASTQPAVPVDGKSLLPLIDGKATDWREYIDLEHDVCYAKENHWSGLTDGKWKYIFHTLDGEEQLFNLEKDPTELHDLAGETKHTRQLQHWRKSLVAHLEPRGDAWVKNNKLALRPESILKSPNYPKPPA